MAAQLNHTIVWSSNQRASAKFLAEMLGRPAPTRFAHFDVVELDNGVSLDFADAEGPIRAQHYAFLIALRQRQLNQLAARPVSKAAGSAGLRPIALAASDRGRCMTAAGPWTGRFTVRLLVARERGIS